MTPPRTGEGLRRAPVDERCPWCGCDIQYQSNCEGADPTLWPLEGDALVWLTCPNEDCPVQPRTQGYETLEEADAAWNRRTPPATSDRERVRVEALEDAVRAVFRKGDLFAQDERGRGINRGLAVAVEAIRSLITAPTTSKEPR